MSFITGKPFIDKVLNGLSLSELNRLNTLINSSNPTVQGTYRTYKLGSLSENLLSSMLNVNGSFKYVSLSFDPVSQEYLKGILCLVNSEYAFISWTPYDKNMKAWVIEQHHYSARVEQLTTEEFRRVLTDLIIAIGEASGDVEIEVVNTLPAQGVENTIYLSKTNAVTDDPTIEIPTPTVADEGKVLMANGEGGYELGDDKDILSKIVYDDDHYSFIFPKNIMPIACYFLGDDFEDMIYFDYSSYEVYAPQDGGLYLFGYFTFEDGFIKVVCDDTTYYGNNGVRKISYCFFNEFGSGDDISLSFQKLSPNYKDGTKLYQHIINIQANLNYGINLVSTEDKPLSQFSNIILQTGSNLFGGYEEGGDRFRDLWYMSIYTSGNIKSVHFTGIQENGQAVDINDDIVSISDTVTEL